jgi:hypothetical protein
VEGEEDEEEKIEGMEANSYGCRSKRTRRVRRRLLLLPTALTCEPCSQTLIVGEPALDVRGATWRRRRRR